jgi:hypothetical protein
MEMENEEPIKIVDADKEILKMVADFWMNKQFDDPKAELRMWNEIGFLIHMYVYPKNESALSVLKDTLKDYLD